MIRRTSTRTRGAVGILAACSLAALAGCHPDMWRQPHVKPLQESEFFADGAASRPLVVHTVPHRDRSAADPFASQLRTNNPYFTGYDAGKLVVKFPYRVDRFVLARGRDRFNIYCSPCHGRSGDGNGFIALRGFALRRPPASYHTARLRKMPIGHFFDVMTNGYGAMYSYASRVEPKDRWAIAAYIRALQLSHNAPAEETQVGAPAARAPRNTIGAVARR